MVPHSPFDRSSRGSDHRSISSRPHTDYPDGHCPNATPESLHHPGHIFPLIARSGGIKERSGHTEGSIDLMKLAGLAPCAVLCELTNDDGTMARLPEIIKFGLEHKYPVVTINDLKEYQTAPDFLPKLVGSFSCPAAENPTTAIMEAAFRHHYMHYKYINCEVGPEIWRLPYRVQKPWDGEDSTALCLTRWKSSDTWTS